MLKLRTLISESVGVWANGHAPLILSLINKKN